MVIKLWLDADPGHDDAIAILLATQCPQIELLGVSTVHGNASAENTHFNASRLLYAFGAPDHILAYPGAAKPLLRAERHDPEIHGVDGLGGVQGLPPSSHPSIISRVRRGRETRAVEAMARAVRSVISESGGEKVTFVTCGPTTNMALFLSVYPELVEGIERIVFMGGGVGIGNRGAVAEFNILCDPEAAQIVLNCPVEKVMIPLNVTHTAILEHFYHSMLLSPPTPPPIDSVTLPPAQTPLRHTLSTLLSFFADAYRSTFGFTTGPPLHDALTIAYLVDPALFKVKRYRVDVELGGTHGVGQTVVDVWDYANASETSWGVGGKNCLVAESLDVDGFFALFLECVDTCDLVSPLNSQDAVATIVSS